MWTDREMQALKASLEQEFDRASEAKEWKRVGAVSEALGLLEQGRDYVRLETLVEEVEALVGSDLILSALEMAGESVPPDRQDFSGVEPAVEDERALGDAVGATGGPDRGPDQITAPPDPLLHEQLLPLLQALRKLRREAPTTIEGLAPYVDQLNRTTREIGEIAPGSEEANRATRELGLLREFLQLFSTLHELQVQLDNARVAKNRPLARRMKQQAEEAVRLARDERLSDDYPALSDQLAREAADLVAEADRVYKAVTVELREYLTQQLEDTRMGLVAQLNTLSELIRDGVVEVPVDMMPDSEGRSPHEVSRELRSQLLTLCQVKAEGLLEESKQLLDKHPDTAQKRAEIAMSFVKTEHVANTRDMQDIAGRIEKHLAEIEEKLKLRQEARSWYERATLSDDLILGLNALAEAERLDPNLPGLEVQRQTLTERLAGDLEAKVQSALETSRARARERQYVEALAALHEARSGLVVLPSHVRLDRAHWMQMLDQQKRAIEDEQGAWLAIRSRLQKLSRTSPRLSHGRIDESWLEEMTSHFSSEERELFAPEFDQLRAELTRRAGDDAIFAELQSRFRQNPLDPSIGALAGGISTESRVYPESQRLLCSHLAQVSLSHVRKWLSDASIIEDLGDWEASVARWWDAVSQRVQAAVNNARRAGEAGLIDEAERTRETARGLHQVASSLARLCKDNQHTEAWAKLVDYAPDAEGRDGLSDALRWLKLGVRRMWRETYMAFVTDHVLADASYECRVRAGAGLQDLRKAKAYIDELEEHQALTEDGDGPKGDCVRMLWAEAEIASSTGQSPQVMDEAVLSDIAQNPDIDWVRLLEYCEVWVRQAAGYSGRAHRTLQRLRSIALAHRVFDLPRSEAIAFLEQERNSAAGKRRDPVLCALTALRQLEDDEQRAEVSKLVADLRARGRSSQRLAEAIDMLAQAYSEQGRGDLEMALATLQMGTDSLEILAPGFGATLKQVVSDVRQRWRAELGQQLFEQAKAEREKAVGLAIFPILVKFRKAGEYLEGDRRVGLEIERLSSQVTQGLEHLEGSIQGLSHQQPESLAYAVAEGEKLLSYADAVEAPGEQLREARKDLQEALAVWKPAQAALSEIQRTVWALLEGDWRWSDDPRDSPLLELSRALDRFDDIEYTLGAELPVDAEQWRGFVRSFAGAVREVAKPFVAFRKSFERDDYLRDEDFDEARQSLDLVQQKVEEWQSQLRRAADELGSARAGKVGGLGLKRSAIDLTRFFSVHDVYGRSQLRGGDVIISQPGPLTSIADARARLEDRRRSWTEWDRWTRQTLELLNSAYNNLALARDTLKRGGQLGTVLQLCDEEIPQALQALGKLQCEVPYPPCGELALLVAKNPFHHVGPPKRGNRDVERQAMWGKLAEKPPAEMSVAWAECIEWELSAARAILGMSELQADSGGHTLLESCSQLRSELEARAEEIDQHIRLIIKPTQATQTVLDTLLARAEAIDRDDRRVLKGRDEYNRRQERVTASKGRR